MAKETSDIGFVDATPPPKIRKGAATKLSREHCEQVISALTDKAETDNPWIVNGEQFDTSHQATARALLYRESFAKYGLVDNIKEVTSTVYSVKTNPETGEKQTDSNGKVLGPWVFGLKLRDPNEGQPPAE